MSQAIILTEIANRKHSTPPISKWHSQKVLRVRPRLPSLEMVLNALFSKDYESFSDEFGQLSCSTSYSKAFRETNVNAATASNLLSKCHISIQTCVPLAVLHFSIINIV